MTRRCLLYLAALAPVFVLGCVTPPAPGRLVDVGTHAFHFDCMETAAGEATHFVLLESGGGTIGWLLRVRPQAAPGPHARRTWCSLRNLSNSSAGRGGLTR